MLKEFAQASGAAPEIRGILKNIRDIDFPDDYCNFICETNGGEGFIGKHYLILWKAEDLECFNREYEVEKYARGLFLIGSNGGGEAFGFDTRSRPYQVVQVPFIGMDLKYAVPVADNFMDLLTNMSQLDDLLN